MKPIKGVHNVGADYLSRNEKWIPFIFVVGVGVVMSQSCAKCAFEILKSNMVSSPILRLPDLQKIFTLIIAYRYWCSIGTKVRGYKVPCRICQQEDSSRYFVKEWECLALVWEIRKFVMYLYGKEFKIETNDYSLIYTQNTKFENTTVM